MKNKLFSLCSRIAHRIADVSDYVEAGLGIVIVTLVMGMLIQSVMQAKSDHCRAAGEPGTDGYIVCMMGEQGLDPR